MMAVAVTAVGNELQLSAPQRLFERSYADGAGITIANYDVAKDGRFLMVKDDIAVGRLRRDSELARRHGGAGPLTAC